MARRVTRAVAAKKIAQNDIIGKRGVALIDTIVGEIGFVWYETGLEAGIDGLIEVRDRATGEVTNNIIQVQSKATDVDFDRETDNSFEFTCDARDLNYWLNGNAPVILIRSRPRTKEAYWVSIKDYFNDPKKQGTHKIVFDKKRDRLCADPDCIQSLTNLAMPKAGGLYLSPMPKTETLYLNLLPIIAFPKRICIAQTKYREDWEISKQLARLNSRPGNAWMLHGGNLYSFYDLSEHPWPKLCERGTLETYTGSVWAEYDDEESQKNFVQLLNRCLRDKLAKNGIDYHAKHDFYYFRDTDDQSAKRVDYYAIQKNTHRMVFEAYQPNSNQEPAHYRHSAFHASFLCFDGTWYLEINPSYYFTADGRAGYRFAHNSLSGIKRLEKNAAVMGQVVMWAELLRRYFPTPDLTNYDEDARLLFGKLPTFTMERGIPDKSWGKKEEAEVAEIIEAEIEGMGLFGL